MKKFLSNCLAFLIPGMLVLGLVFLAKRDAERQVECEAKGGTLLKLANSEVKCAKIKEL